MKKNIEISLLMATYGRCAEVLDFCESLNSQNFDMNEVELIIIDQNDDCILEDALRIANYKFELIYRKESIKSLSRARNIALEISRGKIIGYPDDDCIYYSNTLYEIVSYFEHNSSHKTVMGRIYDRDLEEDIIKKWPKTNKRVNLYNYYNFANSITLFHIRLPGVIFDERMGAGRYFGSAEDVDFLYRLLESRIKVDYIASIEVWHPKFKFEEISLSKVRSYARGLGFFIRKQHLFMMPKYIHLIILICYKFYQLLTSSLTIKFRKGYFLEYFIGVYEGFFRIEK